MGRIYATERRLTKLESSLESMLLQVELQGGEDQSTLPVRYLASVTGQIVSLQAAMGNVVRVRTKELHKCIALRASWAAHTVVSEAALGRNKVLEGER